MFSVSLQLSQSTMTTPATQLPPGIYRITVASFDVKPVCLTRHGEGEVTILPPGAQPDPEQEWRVDHGKDGNIIIKRPSKIFPASYLAYHGAPDKPKKGDKIIYHVSEFPPNEWHLQIGPGFTHLIRVSGSDLGIKVSPIRIFPPRLEIGHENQLKWIFELVRGE